MKPPLKHAFTQINQHWRQVNRLKTVAVLGTLALVGISAIFLLHDFSAARRPITVTPSHPVQFVGPISQDYESKTLQSALLDQQLQSDVTAQHAKELAEKVQRQTQQLAQLTQQMQQLQDRLKPPLKLSPVSAPSTSSPRHLSITHAMPIISSTVHHTTQSPPIPTLLAASYTPLARPIRWPTHHKRANTHLMVPSGTFVRAVLLSGADANASVNGENNTDPVLLRILDQGTLPNGHHASLKGCFITASIYGDISSERGQIRTDRLSCVRPNHQLLDIHVQGTVVGSAGKNGLRGIPVMRNGKILWNASIAGGLSGLSKAAQTHQENQSTSPLGTVTSIGGNALTYAATGGVQSAAEQLAHYYVQRAEQYHPVIQINPGSVVTIIFLKPFSLSTDQPLAGLSTQSVKKKIPDSDDTIGVSLTPQQRAAYLQYIHQVSSHNNPMIHLVPGIEPPTSSTTITPTGGH